MPVPGVGGGVNCGDTRPGSSWSDSCADWREDSRSESWSGWEVEAGSCPNVGWVMWRELRSSSDIARETGIGLGE